MQKVLNVEELNLFVKLIYQLLIVKWDVSIAVSEVIQDVPKVGPVAVDEISPLLVLDYVVPPGKHCSQHAIWVCAQCLD